MTRSVSVSAVELIKNPAFIKRNKDLNSDTKPYIQLKPQEVSMKLIPDIGNQLPLKVQV